jgi:hypothetical protein
MFETTRTITDLVLSGVLERHPGLCVIVPHPGAALPVLADRTDLYAPLIFGPETPQMRKALKQLHFDLSGAPAREQLQALLGVADTGHLYLFHPAPLGVPHRTLVLAVWIFAAGAAIVLALVGGGKTDDSLSVPGTESQQATNLLKEKLPALSGGQTQITFAAHGNTKATDAPYKAGIEAAIGKLKAVPHVGLVTDPFESKAISKNTSGLIPRHTLPG